MTKLGQILQARKLADGTGPIVSRLVSELVEETVNRAARTFTATPPKPKPVPPEQVKQADEPSDAELAQEYRDTRPISAPVTPGEIGLTAATGTAVNYATPRILKHIPNYKDMQQPSVGQAITQTFGPDFVPINLAMNLGWDTLRGPLSDPLYHQGKRTYLKSVGEGMLGAAERMRGRSHEVRDRYGLAGIPVQMLHGLSSPVAGLTYAGQSLGRLLSTKEGSLLALKAEESVKRATDPTRQPN